MRFMVLLKVEAEVGPELNRAMRAYDAELVRAGVADRTKLSARGARTAPDLTLDGEGRTVAGFWVFDLDSREDAAAWVRRCPAPAPTSNGGSAEIEIRLLLEPGDLSDPPPARERKPAWARAMAF